MLSIGGILSTSGNEFSAAGQKSLKPLTYHNKMLFFANFQWLLSVVYSEYFMVIFVSNKRQYVVNLLLL